MTTETKTRILRLEDLMIPSQSIELEIQGNISITPSRIKKIRRVTNGNEPSMPEFNESNYHDSHNTTHVYLDVTDLDGYGNCSGMLSIADYVKLRKMESIDESPLKDRVVNVVYHKGSFVGILPSSTNYDFRD